MDRILQGRGGKEFRFGVPESVLQKLLEDRATQAREEEMASTQAGQTDLTRHRQTPSGQALGMDPFPSAVDSAASRLGTLEALLKSRERKRNAGKDEQEQRSLAAFHSLSTTSQVLQRQQQQHQQQQQQQHQHQHQLKALAAAQVWGGEESAPFGSLLDAQLLLRVRAILHKQANDQGLNPPGIFASRDSNPAPSETVSVGDGVLRERALQVAELQQLQLTLSGGVQSAKGKELAAKWQQLALANVLRLQENLGGKATWQQEVVEKDSRLEQERVDALGEDEESAGMETKRVFPASPTVEAEVLKTRRYSLGADLAPTYASMEPSRDAMEPPDADMAQFGSLAGSLCSRLAQALGKSALTSGLPTRQELGNNNSNSGWRVSSNSDVNASGVGSLSEAQLRRLGSSSSASGICEGSAKRGAVLPSAVTTSPDGVSKDSSSSSKSKSKNNRAKRSLDSSFLHDKAPSSAALRGWGRSLPLVDCLASPVHTGDGDMKHAAGSTPPDAEGPSRKVRRSSTEPRAGLSSLDRCRILEIAGRLSGKSTEIAVPPEAAVEEGSGESAIDADMSPFWSGLVRVRRGGDSQSGVDGRAWRQEREQQQDGIHLHLGQGTPAASVTCNPESQPSASAQPNRTPSALADKLQSVLLSRVAALPPVLVTHKSRLAGDVGGKSPLEGLLRSALRQKQPTSPHVTSSRQCGATKLLGRAECLWSGTGGKQGVGTGLRDVSAQRTEVEPVPKVPDLNELPS